jgi:hypothetical protein
MSGPAMHKGGCHCGKVRYEVATDLKNIVACNCSICSKQGLWLTFVPGPEFKLVSGETSLKDYQFKDKKIHHMFCDACGVESFARGKAKDGSDMIALNVRCLDDVDIASLTPTPFDGKSL